MSIKKMPPLFRGQKMGRRKTVMPRAIARLGFFSANSLYTRLLGVFQPKKIAHRSGRKVFKIL
jgi:hypothetical protein